VDRNSYVNYQKFKSEKAKAKNETRDQCERVARKVVIEDSKMGEN